MFILYFGMMSMITPPIALAAFAAAAITQKSALETGIAAMRFGWVAYIVPFLFIYSLEPADVRLETAEIVLELVTVTPRCFDHHHRPGRLLPPILFRSRHGPSW